MKYSKYLAIPMACLAAVGGAAHAQQAVTIYGLIDAGIANTEISGSAIPANNTRISEFVTGGSVPTFLGFKGEREFNGLKAGFVLEQGINLSPDQNPGGTMTAFAPSPTTNQLYNRLANLFVTGSGGTIRVGTQLSAAWMAVLGSDPRGGANFGSAVPLALGEKMSAIDTNVVSYSMPTTAGFSGTIGYKFANDTGNVITGTGQNGSTATGSGVRALLSYKTGDFTGNFGYYTTNNSQKNALTAGDNQYSGTVVGATYKINSLTLKGILLNQQINGAGPTQGNFQTVGFGGAYQMTDKLGADFGYYTIKDPGSQNLTDTTQTAAGLSYDLMPGVKVYGQFAAIKNNAGAATQFFAVAGTSANGGSPFLTAGSQATILNVGLRYAF